MSTAATRIRICNLPKHYDRKELAEHISNICTDLKLSDCRVIKYNNKSRQFGFAGFLSHVDANKAIKLLNGTYAGSNKLLVDSAIVEDQLEAHRPWSKITKRRLEGKSDIQGKKFKNSDSNIDYQKIIETSRVRLLNLPYETTEHDIKDLLKKYGIMREIKIVKGKDGRSKGYAFLKFENGHLAVKACEKLDGKIFFGRRLKIEPADDLEQKNLEDYIKTNNPEKRKVLLKKLERAHDPKSWNLLYVSAHAATVSVAESLGVKPSEILDHEDNNSSIPAKLALVEALTLEKTKKWLDSLGLEEKAFEVEGKSLLLSNIKSHNLKRTNKTIFVKHLGPWVDELKLKKLFERYGLLSRFSMSPTKTILILTYVSEESAKKAFYELNMYMFEKYPLYLEWGFELKEEEKDSHISSQMNQQNEENINIVNKQDDESSSNTLYFSNLNYSITKEELEDYFSKFPGFIKAIILNSKKTKESLGNGFLVFKTINDARETLKKSLLKKFNGTDLKLEMSKSRHDNEEEMKSEIELTANLDKINSSKLTIKNLPFEINKKDLKELFQPFVNVVSIRIPKRSDGRSRGFGFVEFSSTQDAKKAVDKLHNVHLLGRRLIFECTKN